MPDKSTNEGQWNFVHRVRGFFCERGCVGRGWKGWWELGPHKEESQEDVVWRWQVWTTLNVRFFWTPMPAQVAAVEATSIPPSLWAHNEETVSTGRGFCLRGRWRREIRITMAWVNDVCAVKDTKSLLKKPLGLEVKENESSGVFFTLITCSEF